MALDVAIGIAEETDYTGLVSADGDQFFYARAPGVWSHVLLGFDSLWTILLPRVARFWVAI